LVVSPLATANADATAGDPAWAEACADARALADALAETVRPSGIVTLVEGPVPCAGLTPTRIRPGSTLTPTSDVESVNASRNRPSRAFTATLGSGTGTADHFAVSAGACAAACGTP
jgi:hypothetical protein